MVLEKIKNDIKNKHYSSTILRMQEIQDEFEERFTAGLITTEEYLLKVKEN